jgi:hypothetical protein
MFSDRREEINPVIKVGSSQLQLAEGLGHASQQAHPLGPISEQREEINPVHCAKPSPHPGYFPTRGMKRIPA